MSSEYFEIENCYSEGEKALKSKDYHKAAAMFKRCFEVYEDAESPIYNSKIKNLGENAFEMYNEIVSSYLNEEEFDNIEYGK